MEKNKWQLDPHHSEIYFKVKHLMITTVTGYFRKFSVQAYTEGDNLNTLYGIGFTADVDSIDSNNTQRDEHLKSPDFFNAEEHKQIKFLGISYEGGKDTGKLSGNLTIRGITQPISISVEFGGVAVDAYGQTKAGFSISGKLNRKDFGLTWGAVTEAGNIVVGDEVRFFAEIQLIKETKKQHEILKTVEYSE